MLRRAPASFVRFSSSFAALPISPFQRTTIYALATPPGRGGVGVIRVSGPAAQDVWDGMVVSARSGKEGTTLNRKNRQLTRCRVVHPRTKEVLDDGMAVFFQAPNTYTSLPTLELHIHSGRAVTSSVLNALSSFPLVRSAEPGEFTRLAFENGKIDLTQVEGIRDLVDAETEMQRVLALKGAAGETKARLAALRSRIIKCLANVEALIDFGEGEEIEDGVYETARGQVSALHAQIASHLADNRRGEILRSGIRLALFGPPNAGKSSLLNYLAQREAAIVTPLPGTTRDVLEVSLDVGGMPVIVCDTAGLRESADVVEKIGIERAEDAIQTADITLCLLPLGDSIPPDVYSHIGKDTLVLFNKSDLVPDARDVRDVRLDNGVNLPTKHVWSGSVLKQQGMDTFLDGLVRVLKERYEGADSTPLITHARHRVHLENALIHLEAFLAQGPEDVVLGAEELRYAAQEIGRISGSIGVEDVLDSIFRDFCIGK